jgi:hypothetical protein
MAKKRRKGSRRGRALKKRYGVIKHVRRGHSYVEGAAAVPVRVHGTLYVEPTAMEGIVEEAVEEAMPEIVDTVAEEVREAS